MLRTKRAYLLSRPKNRFGLSNQSINNFFQVAYVTSCYHKGHTDETVNL